MASLCCVTMVYNEALLLPTWRQYYSRIVGEENCFVIDHGSTDGSTESLGKMNRVGIPRSAFDDRKRALFVQEFCAALLRYYDFVLFTDVDEIVVADPEKHTSILSYLEVASDVTTCIGFELRHWLHRETSLEFDRPILQQRTYAAPVRSLCKPSLVRRRAAWTPGFHSYDGPLNFRDLFLFHLAFVDLRTTLARQEKRNAQQFSDQHSAPHHRVDGATILTWMEHWSRQPTIDDATFRSDCPHRAKFLGDMIASNARREGGGYGFDMHVNPDERWRVPERFRNLF